MTVTKTGFQKDFKGSWIAKDPDAQLVYSVDWATEWLPTGSSVSSVAHTIAPTSATDPLTIVTQGVQDGGVTYVELSGGEAGEIYTVESTVTLDDGAVESRSYRIKVEERYL